MSGGADEREQRGDCTGRDARAARRRCPPSLRPAHRAPRPRNHVRAHRRRSARRADAPPPARLGGERRPQLVPDVRTAARALQHRGARHARSRARAANAQHLPSRRLRRRLRGDARDARQRAGDRGRVLDGRSRLTAVVAASPRPRRRPRAVRDHGRLRAQPAHAQLLPGVDVERDGDGAPCALWLGGIKLLPEALFAREIAARYDTGQSTRGGLA